MPSTAASKGERTSITLGAPADVGAGVVVVALPVATVVVEVADAFPFDEKYVLVNTLVDASASMLVLKVAAAVAEGKLEVTLTVVETRLSPVAAMLSMTTVVASDAAALMSAMNAARKATSTAVSAKTEIANEGKVTRETTLVRNVVGDAVVGEAVVGEAVGEEVGEAVVGEAVGEAVVGAVVGAVVLMAMLSVAKHINNPMQSTANFPSLPFNEAILTEISIRKIKNLWK